MLDARKIAAAYKTGLAMTSPEYKTIFTLALRGAIIKYNWYEFIAHSPFFLVCVQMTQPE